MPRNDLAWFSLGALLAATACGGASDVTLGNGEGNVSKGGAGGSSAGSGGALSTGGSGGTSSTGGSTSESGGSTSGSGGEAGAVGSADSGTGYADAGTLVDASPSSLTWHRTCGDALCRVPEPQDAATSPCGDRKEGAACSVAGEECDPGIGCGVMLQCADHKLDRNCPISSERFKTDINYLQQPDLEELAHTVNHIKLATYWYKDQSPAEQKHLGFIIEDNPNSPAVFTSRDKVDLYGYASMAVAALQVQSREIRALEDELLRVREEVEVLRVSAAECRNAPIRNAGSR